MNYVDKLLILLAFIISSTSHAAYEAHEWGTFTSLVGSNGVTQNGMYHEDEPLPAFVHPFGDLRAELPVIAPPAGRRPVEPTPRRPPCRGKMCFGSDLFVQNIITQKMETPVIYFYTDRAQEVEVNVRFPEGVVTDTFPGPVKTFPTKEDLTTIAKGETTFSLKVLNAKSGLVPYVPANNIYSHARDVDSNIVKSGAEVEKFLFYRGIGRFQPQLKLTSIDGSLRFGAPVNYQPQAAFLVHVDQSGHGQMLNLGQIKPNTEKMVLASKVDELKNHSHSSGADIVSGLQAGGMIADGLIQSGLKRDEALAMVNTWENGYLKVPGLRLLYILPRNEVDEILPLKLTPSPRQLVRSFVGRIEILLDTEEQQIISQIEKEGLQFNIESLGRFAEPILRRVREVYTENSNGGFHVKPLVINIIDGFIKEASKIDAGTTELN